MAQNDTNTTTNTVRLGDDNYKKTGNELQNKLTEEDIQLLLEEYDEVDSDNMKTLKPGLYIRYFTLKKKKNDIIKLFRMGGQIIRIDHQNKYLVLSNGKITWSVQFNNNIFYKKMSFDDIKEFYETELDNKDLEINKYKSQISKLKNNQKLLLDENKRLFTELKEIKSLLKKSGLLN